MDTGEALMEVLKCDKCGCSCAMTESSRGEAWMRTVKRKFDEYEEESRFHVPGVDIPQVAHVGIENECAALREMLESKQVVIEEMSLELDEERNASSSAANEAMSMMLRLQREKAEVQMEARQFKRFSEEKIAHDNEEIMALEDMLYKREQTIQALTFEVHAYKHRMMSYGLTESEADGLQSDDGQYQNFNEVGIQVGSPGSALNYPPLRCNQNDMQLIENDDDAIDIEQYPFVETSHSQNHLKNLDYRMNQLERSPNGHERDGNFPSLKNNFENIQSPVLSRNPRRGSAVSAYSPLAPSKELGPDDPMYSPRTSISFKMMDGDDENKKYHNGSDLADETIDKEYTIDSIHQGVAFSNLKEMKGTGIAEDFMTTPGGSLHRGDEGDNDVKKLYQRLQVLEADRESLKQEIICMQTDKAQLVLLREIAQQLCKDMSTERRMPVKKQSPLGNFSLTSVVKWCLSFVIWRKKTRRSKYISLSSNNAGLIGLLDRGPLSKHWRCITSTQIGNRSWPPETDQH